jgi:hypothetical protein
MAVNAAGKLIEFGMFSFGGTLNPCSRCKFFWSNQNKLLWVSGKPVMVPLPTILYYLCR